MGERPEGRKRLTLAGTRGDGSQTNAQMYGRRTVASIVMFLHRSLKMPITATEIAAANANMARQENRDLKAEVEKLRKLVDALIWQAEQDGQVALVNKCRAIEYET